MKISSPGANVGISSPLDASVEVDSSEKESESESLASRGNCGTCS